MSSIAFRYKYRWKRSYNAAKTRNVGPSTDISYVYTGKQLLETVNYS